MKIAVIGTGYVGITTSVSLGELGHELIGVDIDPEKVKKLKQGILPIYEPGVESLIQRQLAAGSLTFTTSLKEALPDAEVIFIAVGTPSLPNGEPDLHYVEAVAREIGTHINDYKVIVNKSTVPVGTADWVRDLIERELERRHVKVEFDVVSNPEFLQEGKALEDARHPDRIVLGSSSQRAKQTMQTVYANVNAPIIHTSPRNAEMIKYASNAILATKISFMNDIAKLCAHLSVDVSEVAKGMGLDQRIGPHFLRAGVGYGGSCFPKDVEALYALGQSAGQEMSILRDTQRINREQPGWVIAQMERELGSLKGKKIALLGLAFKPNTDDLREAPSLKLLPLLHAAGATVRATDPIVTDPVKEQFPKVGIAADAYEAALDADAVLLCTEWASFLKIDWKRIRERMKGDRVFDARNALSIEKVEAAGLRYWGVGRKGSA
ncbi:nucleotide sugar dehydrogenase [Ammoniphilus oxalaticus]|uniref:UDP-glucose 6-dehydrogenase n=1 Tax=Ammoniphilus oxalaticus TaxID=66863 RepID=A0A419SN85_9BACL|nr:UDP-glucose/GDP-mannose dehydrogenase family protein [Ammoniphilus oxalaticus]RKD25770.1 nucleotide sugar dehydrogenase [Ammoniphilus oxalaticus]